MQKTKLAKPQVNGDSSKLTRFAKAEGNYWHQRFGRGLTKWRESQGLKVPEVGQRTGIRQATLYDVEKGRSPGLTAAHVDEICEAIGVDIIELLRLGTES